VTFSFQISYPKLGMHILYVALVLCVARITGYGALLAEVGRTEGLPCIHASPGSNLGHLHSSWKVFVNSSIRMYEQLLTAEGHFLHDISRFTIRNHVV
jgi:hypothetical protein